VAVLASALRVCWFILLLLRLRCRGVLPATRQAGLFTQMLTWQECGRWQARLPVAPLRAGRAGTRQWPWNFESPGPSSLKKIFRQWFPSGSWRKNALQRDDEGHAQVGHHVVVG